MIDTKNIQELLKRKLTRKEFIQVIGLMLLSILGISSLLRNIDRSLGAKTKDDPTKYSSNQYGG